MRQVLCLLMLAVYAVAWECTANAVSQLKPQMAEVTDTSTDHSAAATDTTTEATTEPSTEAPAPTTEATTEPSTEAPAPSTEATTEPSTEGQDKRTDASTKASTVSKGTNKPDKPTSNAETGVTSANASTLTSVDSQTVKKNIANAVKSVENKDGSSIGSVTPFAVAAAVIFGMMAVGPAW